MQRSWWRLCALGLSLVVVAAACGDDDDDDDDAAAETTAAGAEETTTAAAAEEETTTSAAGEDEETTTSAAAEDFTLDEPMRVIGLYEVAGESVNALDDFEQGAQLAISMLNEEGGVGGLDVEYERISTPIDPAVGESAVLQAIDQDPTAMVGLVSSGLVVAVAPRIADAGIPTLYESVAAQAFLEHPETVGSEWGFIMRPRNAGLATSQLQFLVDEVGATNVALLCVNNPFGTAGCDAINAAAPDLGVTIVTQESAEQNATNLDSQVLSIGASGADAVQAFLFPNAVVTLANTMANNGVDLPVMAGASTGLGFDSGGMQDNVPLENFYGVDDCVPATDDRPFVQDWVAAFEEEYGRTPTYQSAATADAINIVANAVRVAQSTEHQAVRDAIAAENYEGLCDPDYFADEGQGMHHRAVFYNLSEDGRVAVSEIEIPPPEG